MIYLAPLQGYTDFVYRKAYNEVFQGVDAFFIPYISLKNDEFSNKYFKEILPENNQQEKVIPQVLVKDGDEIIELAKLLTEYGYKEINLNLGCPYPMVTKREKGAGLLPFPEKIENILDAFFKNSSLKLSVKLRAGLENDNEIERVLPILNRFPLTEIIFHPRVAKQLYKGEIYEIAYRFAEQNTNHKLCYNGDIFNRSDFNEKQSRFPNTQNWMLGRGILMNPFLPSEIKGITYSKEEKKTKLIEFHQLILEEYQKTLDNEGNVINKMQQFWSYFSYSFEDRQKAFKQIKKARSLNLLAAAARNNFETKL